jgi:glycosyltransferase involved in cell wall biosynthesis
MNPLVSVVMPGFNAAPYVEQAVRSALQQTCSDAELVFVDDGSTDGTAAKVQELQREFGDRLTLLQTQRAGPYPARNLALAHARGEYIAFLDADDWWEPNFLGCMLDAMREANADVAYCGWQNVGANVAGARADPYVPPDYLAGDVVALFLSCCPWPIHAGLVRRAVVRQLRGFSERMFSSMDYDFWIRLLVVTNRMVRVPHVLAYYRWHDNGQISATRWRQVLNAWQVRRDFVAANPAMVAHLPTARRKALVDGVLLQAGYEAFWRRDLESAQSLFRKALRTGAWQAKDLKYLTASLLPRETFRKLVGSADAGLGP